MHYCTVTLTWSKIKGQMSFPYLASCLTGQVRECLACALYGVFWGDLIIFNSHCPPFTCKMFAEVESTGLIYCILICFYRWILCYYRPERLHRSLRTGVVLHPRSVVRHANRLRLQQHHNVVLLFNERHRRAVCAWRVLSERVNWAHQLHTRYGCIEWYNFLYIFQLHKISL